MARPRLGFRALTLNSVAAFFGVASLYHLAVIVKPSLGDGGSPWRHAAFVAIDALVGLGLVVRPPFFVWVFTALALQQLHSHGSALLHEWAVMHRIDWQSVLVLAIIPVTWVLLWTDRRSRAARSQSR